MRLYHKERVYIFYWDSVVDGKSKSYNRLFQITDFESTFENPATSLLIRLLLHNTEPFDFENQNELKKSQRRVNARGVVAKKVNNIKTCCRLTCCILNYNSAATCESNPSRIQTLGHS